MKFKDLPIRRKLALLVLTSNVLAVILACVGFAIYERQNFLVDTANELTALADTLGENTAASLAFDDKKTAREMLRAAVKTDINKRCMGSDLSVRVIVNMCVATFDSQDAG